MKRTAWISMAMLALPLLAWAQGPATQPAVATGIWGEAEDARVTAPLGHSGAVLVRTEARWKELQDRLGPHVPQHIDMPAVDFTKQALVLLYTDGRRNVDVFSLATADLAAHPAHLDFLLRWDDRGEEQKEFRYTKVIAAVVPADRAVEVRLTTIPIGRGIVPGTAPHLAEFAATFGGPDGGDVVDGLQARISTNAATITPGEDIRVNFDLHLADPAGAQPLIFGTELKNVYVWDGKYSHGYRNHGFFVTTPNGQTVLLRPKVINEWDKNVPHPVEVTAKKPYALPNWVEGDTAKSLQALGLDTATPGVYTITGLYEEMGGREEGKVMWGGSVTSNTITVEVKK